MGLSSTSIHAAPRTPGIHCIPKERGHKADVSDLLTVYDFAEGQKVDSKTTKHNQHVKITGKELGSVPLRLESAHKAPGNLCKDRL